MKRFLRATAAAALLCGLAPLARAAEDLQFYPASPKAPFSTAVRAGRTLYLSGQIGMRPDGVLPTGFEAQARQTLDNIAATLKELGLGMERIAKCTVMLADMSQWAQFNEIYIGYFKPGRLPARSAFGVDRLALGALLEVECTAYLPETEH